MDIAACFLASCVVSFDVIEAADFQFRYMAGYGRQTMKTSLPFIKSDNFKKNSLTYKEGMLNRNCLRLINCLLVLDTIK